VTGDDRRTAASLGQGGLTLIEVLLAIAIIGIALAGLAIVVPVSSYGVQDGNQVSTATYLAEQMIERARAATWSADPAIDCLGLSTGAAAPVPTGATCPGGMATTFPDEAGGVSGYPQYRRTVRVASCATTPCAGITTTAMRLVEVTVAYAPLTGPAARSSSPNTIRLAWLVSQK
jgi:prepilin-type N-terminal cleavage/methylation domain-containing protein